MTDELNFRRLLAKNTGVQLFTYAISLVLGYITNRILGNYLGVERFGEFTYVIFGFYFYFLTLNDFGIGVVVVREVSKHRARAGEILGALLTLKLFLSLVFTLSAWTVIALTNRFPAEQRTALFLYALILPLSALQLPATIFQVALQFEYPAFIGLANRILTFLLLMTIVWFQGTLGHLVAALVAVEVLNTLALLIFSRKFVKPVWRCDFRLWREVLRSSLPLGIMGIFVALLNRSGFILLERLSDAHAVGLYSAAYRVTNQLEAFPLMVMGTIYPLMSRYAAEDSEKLRGLYKKSVFILGAVALPMGVAVSLLAPWIVRLLYGTKFAGAEESLRILVWATVFLYLALSGGNLLIAMGREKINLGLNLVAATLCIALNVFLIPLYGQVGAAIANAISYLFILIGIAIAARTALRTEVHPLPVSP